MQIHGDQWPLFLYADLAYDPDDPWNGLLRNQLLITVSAQVPSSLNLTVTAAGFQVRIHVAQLRR